MRLEFNLIIHIKWCNYFDNFIPLANARSNLVFSHPVHLTARMLDWELDLNESRSSLKAVCCEDKLHCCPEGTQCDLAHSRCIQTSLPSIPMLVKFPARKRISTPGGGHMTLTKVDQNCWSCLCRRKSLVIYLHCAFDYCLFSSSVASVRCPGGTSSCPDGSTCCLLASGDYGCCPFSEVHG